MKLFSPFDETPSRYGAIVFKRSHDLRAPHTDATQNCSTGRGQSEGSGVRDVDHRQRSGLNLLVDLRPAGFAGSSGGDAVRLTIIREAGETVPKSPAIIVVSSERRPEPS